MRLLLPSFREKFLDLPLIIQYILSVESRNLAILSLLRTKFKSPQTKLDVSNFSLFSLRFDVTIIYCNMRKVSGIYWGANYWQFNSRGVSASHDIVICECVESVLMNISQRTFPLPYKLYNKTTRLYDQSERMCRYIIQY